MSINSGDAKTKLDEAKEKAEKTFQVQIGIINEISTTEESYCKALALLVEFLPICKAQSQSWGMSAADGWYTAEHINAMKSLVKDLGYIDPLLKAHQAISPNIATYQTEALEAQSTSNPALLIKVMKNIVTQLPEIIKYPVKLVESYIADYYKDVEKGIIGISDAYALCSPLDAFSTALKKHNLDLVKIRDALITPVQRYARYDLLLTALYQTLPLDSEMRASLEQAVLSIKQTIKQGNIMVPNIPLPGRAPEWEEELRENLRSSVSIDRQKSRTISYRHPQGTSLKLGNIKTDTESSEQLKQELNQSLVLDIDQKNSELTKVELKFENLKLWVTIPNIDSADVDAPAYVYCIQQSAEGLTITLNDEEDIAALPVKTLFNRYAMADGIASWLGLVKNEKKNYLAALKQVVMNEGVAEIKQVMEPSGAVAVEQKHEIEEGEIVDMQNEADNVVEQPENHEGENILREQPVIVYSRDEAEESKQTEEVQMIDVNQLKALLTFNQEQLRKTKEELQKTTPKLKILIKGVKDAYAENQTKSEALVALKAELLAQKEQYEQVLSQNKEREIKTQQDFQSEMTAKLEQLEIENRTLKATMVDLEANVAQLGEKLSSKDQDVQKLKDVAMTQTLDLNGKNAKAGIRIFELEALLREKDAALVGSKIAYQVEITGLKAQQQQAMNEFTTNNNHILQQLRTTQAQETKTLNETHHQAMQILQGQEIELSEKNVGLERGLTQLKQKLIQEVAGKLAQEPRIKALQDRLKKSDKSNDQFKQQLEAVNKKHESSIQALIQTHETAIANIRSKQTEALMQLDARYKVLIEAQDKGIQQYKDEKLAMEAEIRDLADFKKNAKRHIDQSDIINKIKEKQIRDLDAENKTLKLYLQEMPGVQHAQGAGKAEEVKDKKEEGLSEMDKELANLKAQNQEEMRAVQAVEAAHALKAQQDAQLIQKLQADLQGVQRAAATQTAQYEQWRKEANPFH